MLYLLKYSSISGKCCCLNGYAGVVTSATLLDSKKSLIRSMSPKCADLLNECMDPSARILPATGVSSLL